MLVQLPKTWPAESPAPQPSSEADAGLLSIANLLAILRRRSLLIAAAVAAMLVVGVLYLATTKAMFNSTALVYLDIENAQTFDGSNPNAPGMPTLDDVDVNSQLQIIRSEKIALKVIQQLGLVEAEELTRPQNAIVGLAQRGLGVIRSMIRLGPPPPVLQEEGVPRGIIEAFANRLSVERLDETFVLAIGFRSEDPQRASDAANAVANAYLEEKLDARYESVSRASTWLEGRLSELRDKAVASDQLVQNYKRENNIIDTNATNGGSGQLLSDTQLTELSARLVEARKVTAERRARYNQIAQMRESGNPDASVVDAMASPVINQLRQQYLRLAQQEADVSRRYGAEHQAAQRARQQMEDIKGLVINELGRIEQVYKSDLDVASKQEAELAQQLEGYTDRSSDIAQALVRLRELERNAQADQNLYESFLDRYKTALQQQSFPITDARVLTEASPARKKSSPKTVITLALSGIAGAALGLMLALGRELADRTFRTPGQIERVLGHPCLGVLPKLAKARRPSSRSSKKDASGARVLARDLGVFQHVVKAPLSRFAEALRSVKLAIDFAPTEGGMRVIGVVSSMPGEGKSTAAMNIAELIASSGNTVLVIDADLRSPTLTREITPNATAGLFEFLVNGAPINDLIYSDETKPLKFLPAAGKGGAAQKTDLIGSANMAQLLTAARQTYNYVIIDLPPLAPVIDAKAIAGSVDGFVFVIEWGETSIATVSDALHDAPHVDQKIIGCLLNKADEDTLHLYTSTVGNSQYYSNEKFSSYVSQS
ncbi:MAG TPA: polysaccharide biosynthesis tyrosine autokinase [Rhizobiaceae bacterium]